MLDDFIHCPAVEFAVAYDAELHPVLHGVAFDGFEGVITISGDSFVDGEKYEVDAVVVSFVQGLEDGCEDSGVLSTRRADGDSLAALEEFMCDDGRMDFGLEDFDEAFDAEASARFGSLDFGARRLAVCA